jgi:hypothetical protein
MVWVLRFDLFGICVLNIVILSLLNLEIPNYINLEMISFIISVVPPPMDRIRLSR